MQLSSTPEGIQINNGVAEPLGKWVRKKSKNSSGHKESPGTKLPTGFLPAYNNSPSKTSIGELSAGSNFLPRSLSQTGLGTVIEYRFKDQQRKQEQELERWKRKLIM